MEKEANADTCWFWSRNKTASATVMAVDEETAHGSQIDVNSRPLPSYQDYKRPCVKRFHVRFTSIYVS